MNVGHFRMLRLSGIAVGLFVLGAAGQAQSLGSFNLSVPVSGVTISTSNQLVYNVSVGSNPSFVYNNSTYAITDVIGFWVLSDTTDFNASNGDFSSVAGNWKEKNNNAGTGAIAGWRASNANVGLTPNESETFTFASLSPTASIDGYGLHVRVDGTFPGGGNTGHIRIQSVPEPASLAAVSLGLLGLLRRRRSR